MTASVIYDHIPEGGKGPRVNRHVKVTFCPEAIDAARELDGRLIGLIVANKDGKAMFTFAGPATKKFADRLYSLHADWHTRGKLDLRRARPTRFALAESEEGYELLVLERGMVVFQVDRARKVIVAKLRWTWDEAKMGKLRWLHPSRARPPKLLSLAIELLSRRQERRRK